MFSHLLSDKIQFFTIPNAQTILEKMTARLVKDLGLKSGSLKCVYTTQLTFYNTNMFVLCRKFIEVAQ